MKPDKIIAVRNNKTVFRDGNLCLKVFNRDFSKADILNEALNHARVEEIGLNIPKIKEISVMDGKWTIVTEFIKGKTLEQLMYENPERSNEFLEKLVCLQTEMHSKTCPLLNKLTDKIIREITRSGLSDSLKINLTGRLIKMPKHDKLCHCDFTPSNILIADSGDPYILDWSHAAIGNASADAAMTYIGFMLADNSEAAKNYLNMFCKKSDIDTKYVKEWIPIAASSQLARRNLEKRAILNLLIK